VTQFAESTMTACGTGAGNQCTVPAGMNMNINVTFSPTSPGVKTATLNINNNDPARYRCAHTGRGTRAARR
jgi:hypothetical protein